jgi:hypothetical protein
VGVMSWVGLVDVRFDWFIVFNVVVLMSWNFLLWVDYLFDVVVL